MFDPEKMKQATTLFLEALGEDPQRDGLKETPDRMRRFYETVLNGYDEDPKKYLKLFESDATDAVYVSNIPFYSFCEHHGQLFHGKLSIAYIPQGKVIGLSKLVRIARVFAKRLQVQERLGKQIADFLVTNLSPLGVAVQIKAEHSCMTIRGVRTPGVVTTTNALRGLFFEDDKARQEFFLTIQ